MSEKSTKKSVFLVDGSSFLYRAYYALKPLHSPSGMQVQAIYGFCRMLKKLIDSYKADHIVLVWDSKGKTHRHEIYESYKQTRQAPPSDIFEQKEYIQKIADVIGLKQLSLVGAEADDLMYSLAKKFNKEGYKAIFVSSDKDMRQALCDDIEILDPFRNTSITVESCQQRYGFEISKIPFYFALLGDSADNIPGVKGVGQKGATELVQQFASLDDMYHHLEDVQKERTRKLLEESKQNAFLSYQLFLLHEYDLDMTINETDFDSKNWVRAIPILQELGFKSLIATIQKSNGVDQVVVTMSKPLHDTYDFVLVQTKEQLEDICKQVKQVGFFACDTETTGLDPMQAELVGISICCKLGKAFYVPFGHKVEEQLTIGGIASNKDSQLSKEVVFDALKTIFSDTSIKKYLHNSKFDELVLMQAGLPLHGVVFDTMIAASLLMKDWEKKGLKDLSKQLFNEDMLSYDMVSKKHKAKDFSYVPLQDATEYAAADAHQTLKLYEYFAKKLEQEKLDTLFYDIELPVNDVLIAMQKEGIYCDEKVLQLLGDVVAKDIAKLESDIESLVGKKVNLNSPKQIQELLFQDLGLTPQKKSGKGAASTDAYVLRQLSKEHIVPGLILRYRELYKLQSTYIQALPGYINPKTGRIHTSWNQTLVATGRLSSSNPNLQNIPRVNIDYEVDVRSAFKAEQGWTFVSADYSQVELRILAYLSQDKSLVDAFLQDKDIHRQTASKLFDVAESQVTAEQRDIGKRINFSILYGLTAFGLSKDMDISFSEAKKYIELYFEQYPGVAQWMDKTVEFVKEHGYTKTYFGRRRFLPGIYEKNKTLFDLARRIAVNTPAQGTAAELTKLGMICVQKELQKQKLQAKILLQIHDELLVSCPDNETEKVKKVLQECLESVIAWNVPLIVSIREGKNWQEVSK